MIPWLSFRIEAPWMISSSRGRSMAIYLWCQAKQWLADILPLTDPVAVCLGCATCFRSLFCLVSDSIHKLALRQLTWPTPQRLGWWLELLRPHLCSLLVRPDTQTRALLYYWSTTTPVLVVQTHTPTLALLMVVVVAVLGTPSQKEKRRLAMDSPLQRRGVGVEQCQCSMGHMSFRQH